MVDPAGDDALDDLAENIRVLIAEELRTQHRLGDHQVPVEECPACRAHAASAASAGQVPTP